jgi:hypothetical protein
MTAYYQQRCSSDGEKGGIHSQEEYENYQHCIPLYLFSNDQQVSYFSPTDSLQINSNPIDRFVISIGNNAKGESIDDRIFERSIE